ncbi:GntR family transcriptional regulator [Fluviibacterium sp. DFM31]|uniref:GntR family transcriptional regulator n=1 Tax=Meridianimarinicoccus marinus TaxID=3231483 RepID=A0ABV3L611_9RHOB
MPIDAEFTLPEIVPDDGMTTQDYAYHRLRNAILLGAIPPGTQLTFRGLATMLNLSPTPVREAVRRLSSEHALEVLGNRRLQVPDMGASRFEELILLRIALETHAAERAFPYVSSVLIEYLRELDDRMDRLLQAGRLDDLTLLNQDFHGQLYAANPFQQALPLIESVWLQLGPFQRQVMQNVTRYYHEDRHKEILEALEARDSMALVVAVENDIRDGQARAGRAALQDAARDDLSG